MDLTRLSWLTATRVIALAVAGPALVAGCSADTAAGQDESVVALRVGVAVHDPVWSHHAGAVLALVEGSPVIAKITPARHGSVAAARTAFSPPLRNVGENMATSPIAEDVVYVPQPLLDRVAAVSVDDLRTVETLQAGPAPSYIATDAGSRMLLAAPPDGSAVTATDLQDNKVLPPQKVLGGPLMEVDGAKRGRHIDYHVAGPRGIAHYKGAPYAVVKKGEIAVSAEASAGDLVKPTRVYVAETGTDRLFAVDSRRSLHGLEVVAQARLGEPVIHIGVDETRIYAATESELVVFETNSYEGYARDTFPVVETIDFRGALEQVELRSAPLSGLAVGRDRVYLTLKGQPYVVSVTKPGF